MLTKRLISSIILIAAIIPIIFFLPNLVFALVIVMLTGFSLNEFFNLVQKKGIFIYKYFGILIGMLIPLAIYFQFEPTEGWELFFMISAILCIFILQFTRPDSSQAITGISTTLFGIIYISWFFSFLIKLKFLDGGSQLVLFLLLVTKSSDVGAFLVGSRWGKHALIPRISPQKSLEGAMGGFLFSIGAALASKSFLPHFSILHLLILGPMLAILALLGDLSESLIKRDCQVKDSGTFLPGLGGVLDLVDSLLFATPFFYFYVQIFYKI